jgi:hypothetical protein
MSVIAMLQYQLELARLANLYVGPKPSDYFAY